MSVPYWDVGRLTQPRGGTMASIGGKRPITGARRTLERKRIQVTREPRNILEGIAHGTTVIVQSTGEGDVFLLEGAEGDPTREGDATVLAGYPAFRMTTWRVGTHPLWAWRGDVSSVLTVRW